MYNVTNPYDNEKTMCVIYFCPNQISLLTVLEKIPVNMEFIPHTCISQQNYLGKLNKGILHRTIQRTMRSEYFENDINERMFVSSNNTDEEIVFSSCFSENRRNMVFGFEALVRFRKEISHSNSYISHCAILQLNRLLHSPEIAVKAMKMNFVPRFVKTLKSESELMVRKSLECLRTLATQPIGLTAIIKNTFVVEGIKNTINYPDSMPVRSEAASTVNAISQNYIAVNKLIQTGYVKDVMKCLLEVKRLFEDETDNSLSTYSKIMVRGWLHTVLALLRHLDTLDKLLNEGAKPRIEALAHDGLLLSSLLFEEHSDLRRAAADFFSQLAKDSIGKEGIYRLGLIEPLCNALIKEEDYETKKSIAALLQFATIHKEARKEATRTKLLGYLTGVLTYTQVPSVFRKRAITILTNFAEVPQGRELLQSYFTNKVLTVTIKLDGSREMNILACRLLQTTFKNI